MKQCYKVFSCGPQSGAVRCIAHTVATAAAIGAEILYFRLVIGAVELGVVGVELAQEH